MKRIEERTTADLEMERIEERADRKSIRCIFECGVGKTTGIKNKQEWGTGTGIKNKQEWGTGTGIKNKQEWGTGTGIKNKQEWGTGTGIGNKQEYSCLFPIPVVITGEFL